MEKILLITPPFTQLNTPYPATAYLKGFLNTLKVPSTQIDLGIEVTLQLFSRNGLEEVFKRASAKKEVFSENAERIFLLRESYIQTVDEVIKFLQGKDLSLARQLCTENFLPQASRFENEEDLLYAFGHMGFQDKAKHIATLYLEDISDFIVETLDPHFGFSRYAERLGRSANHFDELYSEILSGNSYVDELAEKILTEKIGETSPELICFSVPFPGNLYSAFKCAQFLKSSYPRIKIAMGGGFPNTELRELQDPRVFEFFDFVTLDDGELPIELLIKSIHNQTPSEFKRTYILENGQVHFKNNTLRKDYKQADLGTPDYSDLPLNNYISVIEVTNPMHSLWSDGRWNKLTMAHGCYWGKCTFCDVSLDYIKLYEPIAAKILVDRIEQLIQQTGQTGFHFVDEAAPPALMRALALEILKRKLKISWWTNIRFEKSFTSDLCQLLKASGCIAVSGGLEVASDRLLQLIQKGVSVEQVAKVCQNLTQSGIMVHTYLMYGYPTQTEQETIDSLEMVRQLFEQGVIHSGFWHQFALTAHSPVGLEPHKYGIYPQLQEYTFANNDVLFEDSTGIHHEKFSYGLKKSLFNYMHGIGFDFPLYEWFDFKVHKTTIKPNFIRKCISSNNSQTIKDTSKILWIGNEGQIKKINDEQSILEIHINTAIIELQLDTYLAEWLNHKLSELKFSPILFKDFKNDYLESFSHFEHFWSSEEINDLRDNGLLII